ncbi:hypothetical protein T484DRAFT_3629115 [Baffinella frigidus]|nr:hypothetical protein T484DRAFT_3629115 [Cryptophyta sp. CCMP2293]
MLKRNYTAAFLLKPPNAEANEEENAEENAEETDDENEEEVGTVKIPGRTTTYAFSLVPNLAEGSQWVAQSGVLKFPGDVGMLVTISAKQTKKNPVSKTWVSACVGSKYPDVEWKDTGGEKHLINASVIKNKQLAHAPGSRWIITADMWGTKKDGKVVLLHTFSLTDGDSLLSPLEDSQANKYFTATPQDLEDNDNSTRFRFTFHVTCELTEAAWVSLKPKESP